MGTQLCWVFLLKNVWGLQKDEPIIPMASTVKPKDDQVIEIAQFAVVTYNKQAGTVVRLTYVESGSMWSISGSPYYNLHIKAQDD